MAQEEFLQKQIWRLEDQIKEEREKHKKEKEELLKGMGWILVAIVVIGFLLMYRTDRYYENRIAQERQIAVEEYVDSLK